MAFALAGCSSSSSGGGAGSSVLPGPTGFRLTSYYAARDEAQGILVPGSVDFAAVGEVLHSSARPNMDGTLDTNTESLTAEDSMALIQGAHAAGKRVLLSIGGHDSQAGFAASMGGGQLGTFVQNILSLVAQRGYDGVDLDMEPIGPENDQDYSRLVADLRKGLPAGAGLTAATANEPALFAQIQDQLDEINVLTYSLAGTYQGWETWYDSPLYTGGAVFMSTGKPLPSCDALVQSFLAAGVKPSKLALGIHFYGDVWTGATGPNQPLTGVTLDQQSYTTIEGQYASMAMYHWDPNVQGSFLSIDMPGTMNDKFIPFDDAMVVAAKVAYARMRGLGGVFVWELGGDYDGTKPAGMQDPLLSAVTQAIGK